MTPDEQLVAAELAHLDALADGPVVDDALYAYVRAWALRKLPVEAAAAALRHKALRALTGGYPWVSTKWPMAVFHLRQEVRWAGVSGFSLPSDAEMRIHVRVHPRAPGRVFPRRRPCHGRPG